MIGFWLRRLSLWICRLIGAGHRLLRHAVVLHLVLLLLLAALLHLADAFTDGRLSFSLAAGQEAGVIPAGGGEGLGGKAASGWFSLWNVMSLWAGGLVVWWVARARRRLVIGGFEDHSGQQTGIDAGGFGVLVATELALLSELFGAFEEGRSIQSTPEKLKPLDATIQTESSGDFLRNTVSAETSFSLGPLQIPVGIVMSLIGQLVQGPRLTGQLHRDGVRRLITVRLLGSRGNRSWSLADGGTVAEDGRMEWRPVSEVAGELACRIFAELAFSREVSWPALSRFAAGVRAYRRSLQTPRARRRNLKEAERCLIQAHTEDPSFDLAFYNLGVVYNELGKLEAADVAFTQAIRVNNRRRGSYYALALINNLLARHAFAREEHEAAKLHLSKAIDLCDQASAMGPDAEEAAHILSLKAIVLWWRGFRMWEGHPANAYREFSEAGRLARRAIWRGWWALCRAELGFGDDRRGRLSGRDYARSMASRHLQNRSSMLLEVAKIQAEQPAAINAGVAANIAAVEERLRLLADQHGPRAVFVRLSLRAARACYRLAISMTYGNLIRIFALRQATCLLRQASGLVGGDASIQLDLGKAWMERGNHRRAAIALATAARITPASPTGWGYLALASARGYRTSQLHEISQRLFGNAAEVGSEELQALVQAFDTVKGLCLQVREFSEAIPLQRQVRGKLAFKAWFLGRFLRFSYRLGGGDFIGFAWGKNELADFLASPARLTAVIEAYERTGNRARELVPYAGRVSELAARGEEGIEPLQALIAEQRQHGHHWEVGEAGYQLVSLYMGLERLDEAETGLRELISYLEHAIHSEVRRRGLYALLARILRLQGRYAAALEEAKKGVGRDPISLYERRELAWVYWYLAEYPAAQSAWEDALVLAPEDPQLHVNLGMAHLAQLDDSRDKPVRRAHLDRATECLNLAMDLFDDADPLRNSTRFKLYRAYSLAGRRTEALRELRALDRSDYCNLAVAIELADAHLGNDDWAEAERRFRQAAAEVDRLLATAAKGVDETVETPIGEGEMVLGSAAAFAHLGIAVSLHERQIFLDSALAEVAKARAAITDLANSELKARWQAGCDLQEGVILFKGNRIDPAIVSLEKALAAGVDLDTCYHLANALVRKAEQTDDAGVKTALGRRAFGYYQEAAALDWNGEYAAGIGKGRAELQAATGVGA
ncbi:MAG: hypothetical protein AB1568_08620 [Thermodesulfobacteriota bacterium]